MVNKVACCSTHPTERRKLPKCENYRILADVLYVELVGKFPAPNVLIIQSNILWREPTFKLRKEGVVEWVNRRFGWVGHGRNSEDIGTADRTSSYICSRTET